MTIQQIAQERGIKFLLHFTSLRNLADILTHGLLPKDQFEHYSVSPVVNDDLRLDRCPNASCLSIGFPNYKMFFQCRQKDQSVEWAVIAIQPSVLWTKDCAFCVQNAASNAVTAIPLPLRKTVDAFSRMFDEYPGKPSRLELKLPASLPTNPQAEVLVFERIEPELIGGVAFTSTKAKDQFKAFAKDRQMAVVPNLFRPRIDYPHWK